jgi:large subunit ribosomal protein L15
MRLHDLRPAEGSRKERTRVGRGIAAGKGKTAGRGTKGQKARAGGGIPAWFEGGQTPLHQRIPKLRGFKNRFKIEYEIVNVGAIAAAAERGAFELEAADAKATAKTKAPAQITVNQDILRAVGLVRSLNKPLKILGAGELTSALFVVADAFTASARSKIEAAGGTVNVLEVPTAPLKAIGVEPGDERTAPKQSRGAQEATAKEARARTAREETAEAAQAEAAAPKKARAKAEPAEAVDDAPTATVEPAEGDAPAAAAEPAPSETEAPAATAEPAEAEADTQTSDADEATTAAKPKRASRAKAAADAEPSTDADTSSEPTTAPASATTDEAETTSGDDA